MSVIAENPAIEQYMPQFNSFGVKSNQQSPKVASSSRNISTSLKKSIKGLVENQLALARYHFRMSVAIPPPEKLES